MRIALAIVYIWFGVLKIIGLSPDGELVEETVFWFRPEIFIPIHGIGELVIGLGLLVKRLLPITIVLLLLQMIATIFPLFLLTEACFDSFPYRPTLVGKYIIKNIVLVAGALVIAGKHNNNCIKKQQELNRVGRGITPPPSHTTVHALAHGGFFRLLNLS